jgi:proteic killer suppression protein
MTQTKKPILTLLTSTVNSRIFKNEAKVEITKFASKQIVKLPKFILEQTLKWIEHIRHSGLQATRLSKGYHDEALKGDRQEQRSIRLNRSWRLIYEEIETENKTVVVITILEINKHEY